VTAIDDGPVAIDDVKNAVTNRHTSTLTAFRLLALAAGFLCAPVSGSQQPASTGAQGEVSGSAQPEPKNWTTAEDHRSMMEQLGIKTLRPGPSGNESAPNSANYDEALANPYPRPSRTDGIRLPQPRERPV
jgi:hypothetical protein